MNACENVEVKCACEECNATVLAHWYDSVAFCAGCHECTELEALCQREDRSREDERETRT